MIEIKFTGESYAELQNGMHSYLGIEALHSEPDKPEVAITYKAMESSSEDRDHTVTMLGVSTVAHPVACTCMWFRFHPHEKWCAHMKKARIQAINQ